MERVTSKTNDCYVEFISMQDAVHAVEKHNKAISNGRQNRLGDRPVELELSSQAALMKDLFPHANGIRWEGAQPVVLEDHPTEPWSCFKGFITEEEMICLVKVSISPHVNLLISELTAVFLVARTACRGSPACKSNPAPTRCPFSCQS